MINPTLRGEFMIAGSPVRIVSQFPDVAPGGDAGRLRRLEIGLSLVAVSMQFDPSSMGYCICTSGRLASAVRRSARTRRGFSGRDPLESRHAGRRIDGAGPC